MARSVTPPATVEHKELPTVACPERDRPWLVHRRPWVRNLQPWPRAAGRGGENRCWWCRRTGKGGTGRARRGRRGSRPAADGSGRRWPGRGRREARAFPGPRPGRHSPVATASRAHCGHWADRRRAEGPFPFPSVGPDGSARVFGATACRWSRLRRSRCREPRQRRGRPAGRASLADDPLEVVHGVVERSADRAPLRDDRGPVERHQAGGAMDAMVQRCDVGVSAEDRRIRGDQVHVQQRKKLRAVIATDGADDGPHLWVDEGGHQIGSTFRGRSRDPSPALAIDVRHDTDAVSGVFERRQAPRERSRQHRRSAPGRRDHTDEVTNPQRWREKGEPPVCHCQKAGRRSAANRPIKPSPSARCGAWSPIRLLTPWQRPSSAS